MSKPIDITGSRFTKLEAIRPLGLIKGKGMLWLCKCDCGNTCKATTANLRFGRVRSCGCLHKESAKITGEKNRIEFGEASFNDTYKRYIVQARRRSLDFKLSREQFKDITSKNCHYCNTEPKQISHAHIEKYYGLYYGNGIDRVDPEKGYTEGNCVPCCKVCNIAKFTMTEQEFKDWIIKVYNNYIINERNSGF